MRRCVCPFSIPAAFLIFALPVAGQTLEISVTDSASAAPVEGALVGLYCDGDLVISDSTDASGQVVLNLPYTGAEEPDPIPAETEVLSGPYPNPFAGRTRIVVSVDEPGSLTLGVHDLLGRVVVSRVEEVSRGGIAVEIDLGASPPGAYFLRAGMPGGRSFVRRLIQSESAWGAPGIRTAGWAGPAEGRAEFAAAGKAAGLPGRMQATVDTCRVRVARDGYRDGRRRVLLPGETQVAVAMAPGVEPDFVNAIGMRFKRILAGTFRMGTETVVSPITGPNNSERPVHQVTLTRDFHIGAYEVTQKEWKKIMGTAIPNQWEHCPLEVDDNCPQDNMSWYDAMDFVNGLSQLEGLSPCYGAWGDVVGSPDGNIYRCPGYRLVTEAEWEFAAGAGSTADTWWGEKYPPIASQDYEWLWPHAQDKAHPVGQKLPNPWGLYDMAGNASEWVHDWYDSRYYGRSPSVDPAGPERDLRVNPNRVIRAADFSSYHITWCRTAHRYNLSPDYGRQNLADWALGVRVARSILY